MFATGTGGMPSPGVPDGGSSSLLNQYAAQAGVTLGQVQPQAQGPEDPFVWMGYKRVRGQRPPNKFFDDMPHAPGGPIKSKVDNALKYSEVLANFDKLGIVEQRQMAAYLALAGYLPAGGSDATYEDIDAAALSAPLGAVRAAYEDLIKDAMDRQANIGQKISPTQLLERSIAYRLAGDGIKWNGKFGSLNNVLNFQSLGGKGTKKDEGPQTGDKKTVTQVSTTRDILDPEDAKGLTRAMLQQELGRDPTQAEYEDFIAMLQHAQSSNPTTSKTTAQMVYDEQGGGWRTVSDSTTTHQGISSQGLEQMAYEKATQQPDWAEWQAMGTYAPALFSALGATVPGVGGS
jgi:hypothetical protein